MVTRRNKGPVERAVTQSIREIGELPQGLGGLAEVAKTLAKSLDEGAGLATAAVARELRATLVKLAEGSERDDGPDPLDELVAKLSAPVPAQVRDPEV